MGIITETDLLSILPELLEVHQLGIRATYLVKEEPGQLAKVTRVIADRGGNFISFVKFAGDNQDNRLVTIKVDGLSSEAVRDCLDPIVEKVVDMRKY